MMKKRRKITYNLRKENNVHVNVGRDMHPGKIMEIPRRYIVEKKVQNLSLNVRNYAFSFKVWLGENLLYF